MKEFPRRWSALFLATSCILFAAGCTLISKPEGQVVHLLKGRDLDEFYPFLQDFGANHDPDKVFSLDKGVLHISGQHYVGSPGTELEFAL